MNNESVQKRQFAIFLSHSSEDKISTVDKLYYWLNDIADIRVWYDSENLQKGISFVPALANSIVQCRSMVIVLSAASVKSAWVQQEYNFALNHMAQFRDFKIIPIVVDDVEVPGFLQNQNHIRMSGGQLTTDFCDQLIGSLYSQDASLDPVSSRDIYISRTWRDQESNIADTICRALMKEQFRLIGDSKDHPSFTDSQLRVESIIASCGGMVAILPHRSGKADSGNTSKYMVEEIRMAMNHRIPLVIFAEEGVELTDDVKDYASSTMTISEAENFTAMPNFAQAIGAVSDSWRRSQKPHQLFFAGNSDNPYRNHLIQKNLQRITGMACVLGDNVRDPHVSVQKAITERIKKSFLFVGDISVTRPQSTNEGAPVTKTPINTFIELGMARGLDMTYYLITRDQDQRPPFMFRDSQLFYYTDDTELIGLLHSLAYPFRRRVLNYELTELSD